MEHYLTKLEMPLDVVSAPGVMVSEDLSYFLMAKPGCFLFVGSSKYTDAPEKETPHHRSDFDFDEEACLISATCFVRIIQSLFGNNPNANATTGLSHNNHIDSKFYANKQLYDTLLFLMSLNPKRYKNIIQKIQEENYPTKSLFMSLEVRVRVSVRVSVRVRVIGVLNRPIFFNSGF